MSALDALLKADTKKITERPTAKIEIPRLSAAMGNKFELEVRGLPGALLNEITEDNTTYGRHGQQKTDNYKTGLQIIAAGTIDPEFKNQELMKKLGVPTPYEAVEKLLLPGEMGAVAAKITELCGVIPQAEVDEEVKN